ncbi:MAG: hypothetical protein AAGA70_13265 [Pseudomonadota bacterium]
MHRFVLTLPVALTLAACMPPTAGVPTEETSTPAAASATETGVPVSMPFRVAISEDRQSAIVGAEDARMSYTGRDVELAAEEATGCSATIFAGEWSFLATLRSSS